MRRVAALAIALVAAACTSSNPSPPSVPRQHSPLVSPTTSAPSPPSVPSATPTATATETPAAGQPNVTLIARTPAPIDRVVAGEGAVYALVQLDNNQLMRVVRFDPSNGSTTSSTQIRGATDLVLAGGSLWVSDGGILRSQQPASRSLFRMDPSSLRVLARVQLPTAPGPLAVVSAGLWVGATRALYLLDPSSGRIVKTVAVRGAIGRLAVDPRNDLLYDSTHQPHDLTVGAIEERDGATGSLVSTSSAEQGALVMNALAGTPEGVWAAVATGMLGNASFYDRSGLRPRGTAIRGANGIGVDYVDGVLWIPDAMTGHLRCADPVTGAVRAWIPRVGANHDDSYASNIVAIGTTFYIGALNAGLVRIDPGRACGRLTAN